MRAVKLLLIFLICFPAFSGVKAVRSATNPATSIGADGKINLVTTSNTPRTKNYYDTTGFHLLSGVLKEVESTNYLLNTFFSIDTGSDGSANSWTFTAAHTKTLETCAINNITNGKSQKVAYTFAAEATRYSNAMSQGTANDSFDASGGNINITLSFWARGDLTGLTTGATSTANYWVGMNENNNTGTFQKNPFTTRKLSEAATDGLDDTEWRRFEFQGTVTDTDTRKLGLLFCYFGAADGSRPTTGESFWIEIYGVQIEKQTTCTSFIPTTTAVLTRNAETFSNPLFIMGD